MTTKAVTVSILVATTAALVGWDIHVATNAVTGDTISEVWLGWTAHSRALLFAFGVVAGHLCWPQYIEKPGG